MGTLTVAGNTTINSGARFSVEAAASGTSNRLAIEGASTTVDFKTGSILDLALVSGFTRTSPASFTLVSLPGGSGNNILLDGVATTNTAILGSYVEGTGASGAVIIEPSGMTLDAGDQFLLVRSGDSVQLQFSPVPEPGTILAIAAGALGLGSLRRRLRSCPWSSVVSRPTSSPPSRSTPSTPSRPA